MTASSSIPNFEQYWKVSDVVRLMQFKKSWVYEMVERGELPHMRFGSSIRFVPAEVRAWAEARSTARAKAPVLALQGGRR